MGPTKTFEPDSLAPPVCELATWCVCESSKAGRRPWECDDRLADRWLCAAWDGCVLRLYGAGLYSYGTIGIHTVMRIIAYIRVSTTEQADSGLGLEAQRRAITREAKSRGWQEADIEWVEDAGFSAKSLKRPGLALALDALKRGDASILVVAKTDRLSRSLLDFAGILQRAQRQGWALLALDSPADLTTAQGEAMASVMAVFAQLERRLIGERTSAAMAAAKDRGVKLGRPRLLSDQTVERMRAERDGGMTFRAIAAGLNDDGVPTAQGGTWHPATVRKALASRA